MRLAEMAEIKMKNIRKTHSVPCEQSNDQRAGRVAYRQYTQILSYNAI